MIDAADVKPGYYWARYARSSEVTIVRVVDWPEDWSWYYDAEGQVFGVWRFERPTPYRLEDFVFVAPVAPLEGP
ncbi:hypothetical protein [Bradyrhizobium sp.]